jgi:hypothetical protein
MKPLKIDHVASSVNHLHDIHNYVRQHLKLASDRMKTRYNELDKCADYHEGDKVWFYCPTCPSSNPLGRESAGWTRG